MKVLIFYASYGGGHLNAAKSIFNCINEHYPDIDVEMIDCMKYVNKPIEKVSTAAYREMAKKAPKTWGRIYSHSQRGPLAHFSSDMNKLLSIKLFHLLKEKQPDLVISTHPFSSQMCSMLKKKGKINAKIATIMTDFAPHDQWLIGHKFVDYYFIANNKMRDYLIKKKIDESKIHVTGIPISEKFSKEFNKVEIRKKYNLQNDRKTILFFAGGEFGLGEHKILKIFESFITEETPIQVIAIAGKNPKMQESFNKLLEKNPNKNPVTILGFSNEVPELMSVTDLIVTKPGGLTTSESLASHLPMLIINPIPGQEEENAEFLESHSIAVWLKDHDNIQDTIHSLVSDNNKLTIMKENTNLLAHPESTHDICKILFDSNI